MQHGRSGRIVTHISTQNHSSHQNIRSILSFFIAFLVLLVSILGCRIGASSTANQEDEFDVGTPQPTKIENNESLTSKPTRVLESNFKINALPKSDEVIFFSSTDFVYMLSKNLLSVDLDNNQYTCLTCELFSDYSQDEVGFHVWPALSPDSRYLYALGGFQNQSDFIEFEMIDLRTGRFESIDSDLINPAWSPDSTRIAGYSGSRFVVIDSTSGQIIYDSSVSGNSYKDCYPTSVVSWAPDNRRLVYDSNADQLVILDIEEKLINLPLIEQDVTNGSINLFTNWSPDGQQILFVSDLKGRSTGIRWDAIFDMESGGENTFSYIDLFILKVDDSSINCITCTYEDPPQLIMHPVWSPDGEQIAFFNRNLSELPQTFDDLYVINADGTNLKLIATFPSPHSLVFGFYGRYGGSPRWSKDGKQLLFSALDDGRLAIFTIKADGSDLQIVAADPDTDFINPEWINR